MNTRVERTVILNDITQDNNNIPGDESNKTTKFNRLERSMKESVSKFHSVVEAEQQNGGPQKNRPLVENKNLAIRSNQKQGIYKAIRRRKSVEIQSIAVGIEKMADACEKKSIEK